LCHTMLLAYHQFNQFNITFFWYIELNRIINLLIMYDTYSDITIGTKHV
jgi:hypothetical protein